MSPLLDLVTADLTAAARAGTLDPVFRRDREIERVLEVLLRRTRSNVLLVGEAGIGKTAIVRGVAQRLASEQVPASLAAHSLLALDVGALTVDAAQHGPFVQRLAALVDEIGQVGGAVLYVDDLQRLIGKVEQEGMSAELVAALLATWMGRSDLQIVGAMTPADYQRMLAADSALQRQAQTIQIEEPSALDTTEIVRGLRRQYEEHHGVQIPDDAIRAAVQLSLRYVRERRNPGKVLDLLDEAAGRRQLLHAAASPSAAASAAPDGQAGTAPVTTDDAVVTPDDVAEIMAGWTGLPFADIVADQELRILRLEPTLRATVPGQDDVIRAIARVIRQRGLHGAANPLRRQGPIGSFMLLGPDEQEKRRLAKALAELLFGTPEALVDINLSDYMERHMVTRLIGSPPGYIGYEEGGVLTEAVLRRPECVVLFEGAERGHPEAVRMVMQIAERGSLLDGKGRTVDFRNCVLLMTADVGDRRRLVRTDVEGGKEENEKRMLGELKRIVPALFLEAFDEVRILRQTEKPAAAPRARRRRRFKYDVAISFAGPQRVLAERLAAMVQDAEYEVFYDGYLQHELWGKDLAVTLDDVYQRESRYCVMIVSTEYAERMWTIHERRSALARAIQERGNDYILPLKVDATELPGLVPTIAYLSLSDHPLDEIGKILLRKLQAPTAR